MQERKSKSFSNVTTATGSTVGGHRIVSQCHSSIDQSQEKSFIRGQARSVTNTSRWREGKVASALMITGLFLLKKA